VDVTINKCRERVVSGGTGLGQGTKAGLPAGYAGKREVGRQPAQLDPQRTDAHREELC
jgi:hypothetical protein